jgi:hypothetical protein
MKWNRVWSSHLDLLFILVEVLEGIDRRRILGMSGLAGFRSIFYGTTYFHSWHLEQKFSDLECW